MMNTLSLSEAVLRFTNDFFDVIFDSKIDKISSKGSIKELGDMHVAIC